MPGKQPVWNGVLGRAKETIIPAQELVLQAEGSRGAGLWKEGGEAPGTAIDPLLQMPEVF